MIVLLNGAFGIGKTTVARLVAQMLPGTRVFNPELLGVAIQRSARLVGRSVEDFQDMPLWRRLTVLGIQAAAKLGENVIVPMAFSNLAYLTEVRRCLSHFDPNVVHICLVAPVEIVHDRLRLRGEIAGDPRSAWQYRRSAECCLAHRDSSFAEHLPSGHLTAHEVAALVASRVNALRR